MIKLKRIQFRFSTENKLGTKGLSSLGDGLQGLNNLNEVDLFID